MLKVTIEKMRQGYDKLSVYLTSSGFQLSNSSLIKGVNSLGKQRPK